MSTQMRSLAPLPGTLSRQRLAMTPAPRLDVDAVVGLEQRWPEKLFLVFAFLVLQGAFVGLASSIGSGQSTSDEGSDPQHLVAFVLLILGGVFFSRKYFSV